MNEKTFIDMPGFFLFYPPDMDVKKRVSMVEILKIVK